MSELPASTAGGPRALRRFQRYAALEFRPGWRRFPFAPRWSGAKIRFYVGAPAYGQRMRAPTTRSRTAPKGRSPVGSSLPRGWPCHSPLDSRPDRDALPQSYRPALAWRRASGAPTSRAHFFSASAGSRPGYNLWAIVFSALPIRTVTGPSPPPSPSPPPGA
jgi:hypothetical protein